MVAKKITLEQVEEARVMLIAGDMKVTVAKRFNISASCLSKHIKGSYIEKDIIGKREHPKHRGKAWRELLRSKWV